MRLADCVLSPGQDAEDGRQGAGSATLLFAYVIKSDDAATEGIGVPDNPLGFEEGDAIVDAANADLPARVAGDEDDPIEVNIPAERTKVDGTKDFLLRADAGDDQDAKELSHVTLDGSESRSGDPDDIEYAWAFKGGEAEAPQWLDLDNADEAVATFTVPNLPAPVALTTAAAADGATRCPRPMRQTRILPRASPEAAMRPSPLIDTSVTTFDTSVTAFDTSVTAFDTSVTSWPGCIMARSSLPVATSHRRTESSRLPDMAMRPSMQGPLLRGLVGVLAGVATPPGGCRRGCGLGRGLVAGGGAGRLMASLGGVLPPALG